MSIRNNTFINIGGAIIPMAVMLVTVPLYLKALGDVRYGVLALVWLMLSYFGFLEMGLGKSTANHIARLHDAPDRERGTIFWTALLVNAAFGVVAALFLALVGSYLLNSLLKIPDAFRREALAALPWMVATLPLALVSSVLSGALEGRNRFLAVNVLQIASTIIFQIVPLICAYTYGPSLSVVIPAAVLSRACMNLPFLLACFRYVPLDFHLRISKDAIKSLVSYGGWVALTGLISPLLETIDRFLIGVVIGAQAVTCYTIPYQLVSKARILPGSLARALFPTLSAADRQDADQLAVTSLKSLLILMTPMVIGSIIAIKGFMTLWIGAPLAAQAAPLGEVLLLGVWGSSLAQIPYSLLQGKGRPDVVAKFHAWEIAPFLLILWGSLQLFGVYGAAWAWTLRALADAALLFRYSGMPKGSLGILRLPAVLVLGTTIGRHCLAGRAWYWSAPFALVLLVVLWGWIKRSRTGDIGLLPPLDKVSPPSTVSSGEP